MPSSMTLEWPRRDGDRSLWPKREESGIAGWHEQLSKDDPRYRLYQTKIGQFLAKANNLPGDRKPDGV